MQKAKKKTKSDSSSRPNPRISSIGLHSLKGIYPDRPDKPNQDSLFIKHIETGFLAAVADGHGYYGEQISSFLTTYLNQLLPFELSNPSKLFQTMNEALKKSGIDLTYSGSTLSLVYFSDKLHIYTVGDSPVLLGKASNKSKLVFSAQMLSKIHKLEDREEAQRVARAGGRITWGPPSRLWLRDKEAPGLSVTRAFGDLVASSIGVIVEPFVEVVEVEPNDKFLVVASDGVTDWLTPSEICAVVRTFWMQGDAQGAAGRIVAAAREKCKEVVVDDMSCVVLFFEG